MRPNISMSVITLVYLYKKKGFVMVTTLFNTFSQILKRSKNNLYHLYINTNRFRAYLTRLAPSSKAKAQCSLTKCISKGLLHQIDQRLKQSVKKKFSQSDVYFNYLYPKILKRGNNLT